MKADIFRDTIMEKYPPKVLKKRKNSSLFERPIPNRAYRPMSGPYRELSPSVDAAMPVVRGLFLGRRGTSLILPMAPSAVVSTHG